MMEKIREIKRRLSFLDPFTYVDKYIVPRVHAQSPGIQWAVFAASYVALLFLISLVVGFSSFLVMAISFFYAYLFFFDRQGAVDWGVYLLSAFVFAWAIYSAFGLLLGTASPFVIVVSGSMEPLYHRGDVIILQGASFPDLAGLGVQLDAQLKGKFLSDFAQLDYVPYNNSKGKIVDSIAFGNGQEIKIGREGSIVVYNSPFVFGSQGPIIHRIVAKINASDGHYFLTKGDNPENWTIDQDCGKVSLEMFANGLQLVPEQNCIMLYPVKEDELQGKALLRIPLLGCVKLWLFDNPVSLLTTGKLPEHFSGIC